MLKSWIKFTSSTLMGASSSITTSNPDTISTTRNEKTLHPPRAPPEHLRIHAFQICSRLSLIPSFKPWLLHTRTHVPRRQGTSFELLYDCLAFGAPLGTLVVLLGAPPVNVNGIAQGKDQYTRPEDFDFAGVTMEDREAYFAGFVASVQMLEAQGRLGYGEVLRSEDFLSGTMAGFGKVLRTVYRLMMALEETYPGIFAVSTGASERRKELLSELVQTERVHVEILKGVFDAATKLSDGLDGMQPCLECFLANKTKLIRYHERLLGSIEEVIDSDSRGDNGSRSGKGISWTEILGLDDDTTRTMILSAYRVLCINYPSLISFLDNTDFEPALVSSAQFMFTNTSLLISRISNYALILQDILDVSVPANDRFYNSLCETVLRFSDMSSTMDEVALQIRTMHCLQQLRSRTYIWPHHLPEPEDLGTLLLDDRVRISFEDALRGEEREARGEVVEVFLFESMVLVCVEGSVKSQREVDHEVTYPIEKWELGPALTRTGPLNVLYAIELTRIDTVDCADVESLQITWMDQNRMAHRAKFVGMSYSQWDQWITTIGPFVPPIYRPSEVLSIALDQGESGEFSEDEDGHGNLQTHARPWSVIARKGPRSESSSLINQERNVYDDFLVITPEALPTLFDTSNNEKKEFLRSPSPFNLSHAGGTNNQLPTPPSENGFGSVSNLTGVKDLTGKVEKQDRYAFAHGGFSDIWKGTLLEGERSRNVAVKVLRSKIDDKELEEKMIRRLRCELSIWKNLNHPNILSLLGTASDFGHYTSMVCPWMENGSVSKHLERCGDIMSPTDRLKLLCEVAEGLSYLHSHSIVHGDLTGSNILITDDGKACLCDFGLSTIAAEFHGTSYLTSTIGGAVRWADALFYRVRQEEEQQAPPAITIRSDIYSFGSVMLEILSGRIPYHYIRADVQVVIELHKGNKPRRPAKSFVSDEQWEFMMRCWSDDVGRRPSSLEVSETMQMFYDTSLQHLGS